MKLTAEQIKRTEKALAETKKQLAKEEAYPLHLQKVETLDSCKTHIAKLETTLATGE